MIISGGRFAARTRRRHSWWNQAVSQAADEGLAVPHSEPCFSLSSHLSHTHRHTHTHLCFLPDFFPAHAALWLSSPVWIIALSHGYHDLTQTTFVSSFITVPPWLSTLVYSSMLYFCIPASRVKMHVTSTTENNPQKSPVIFAQICKCQRQ